MKKLFIASCAIILLGSWIGLAHAVPITFTDITRFTATGTTPAEDLDAYGRGTVHKLEGFGDYVKWTHHFDFEPALDRVLTGSLSVYLEDDDDFCWEVAFSLTEDGQWKFGKMGTGDYVFDISASYLEDGEFTVLVASLWGDFYIDRSELKITYEPLPVPEPTTLLLLGFGAFGLCVFKKKSNYCKS